MVNMTYIAQELLNIRLASLWNTIVTYETKIEMLENQILLLRNDRGTTKDECITKTVKLRRRIDEIKKMVKEFIETYNRLKPNTNEVSK